MEEFILKEYVIISATVSVILQIDQNCYHQTKSWELWFGLREKREERMAFGWVVTAKDDAPKKMFVWSYTSPDFVCKENTDVDEWNQRHSSAYRKEKVATVLSRSGSWRKLGKNIDFLSGSSPGEIRKQVHLRYLWEAKWNTELASSVVCLLGLFLFSRWNRNFNESMKKKLLGKVCPNFFNNWKFKVSH